MISMTPEPRPNADEMARNLTYEALELGRIACPNATSLKTALLRALADAENARKRLIKTRRESRELWRVKAGAATCCRFTTT